MDTPYKLIVLEETESTQEVAKTTFTGRPQLVVAHRQTAGRGRSGRRWETAPRGLAASLALRPEWQQAAWSRLPLLAGVAACSAVPADVSLKWPNDLMVGSAKCGGILIESDGEIVTIGLGLNLWWEASPDGIGAVFRSDPGPSAALDVATAWAQRVLAGLRSGQDDWGLDIYRSLCQTIGQDLTWHPNGEGRAVGIAEDGGLVVDTGTDTIIIRSGEVTHIRMRRFGSTK